ncbi:MAG: flagellar basal body protein [Planctomycetes bacterium]|nr:flagellar basal body protein [Planctomycetota bacterium]NUQ35017.1 hypothetical protein [Planctomycetaceae bacterium]
MFEAFDASGSGLWAERVRMTAIANNLANVHTTRNPLSEREPFRRKLTIFMEGNANNSNPDLGVTVHDIIDDNAAPRVGYDPSHPDAVRFSDLFQVDEKGQLTDKRRPEYEYLDAEGFDRLLSKVGYVEYPNIDPVMEMKDAMLAQRAYQANVTCIEVSKQLIHNSLQIIA